MNQDERDLMQKEIELEEKWHPLNRVERPDYYEGTIKGLSWITGTLAAICAALEVAHHFWGWF